MKNDEFYMQHADIRTGERFYMSTAVKGFAIRLQ